MEETSPSTQPPRSGQPQLGGLVPRGAALSRRCSAVRKQDGEPCGNWALVGGSVCRYHGGSAPQVREAARRRLLQLVPMAMARVEALAAGAESEPVQLRAAQDILDRAGLRPAEELVVSEQAPSAQLDGLIAAWLEAQQAESPTATREVEAEEPST